MTDFIYEKCGKAKVVFTSRIGGVSLAPYDSLNVGTHVGDDLVLVEKNRDILFGSLDLPKGIFLRQTHCNNIFDVDNDEYDQEFPPEADASISKESNKVLVSMIADCGPLVLSCGEVVATVHASAKTVCQGLIEKTITAIREKDNVSPIQGLLGPCIHPENYEYDGKHLEEMVMILGEHVRGTTLNGMPAFDLPAAIKFECEKFGVSFNDLDIDTFSNENYFSYRRDGITGRQCVIAWI